MFLTKQNFGILYNGEAVIIIRDGELGELADTYEEIGNTAYATFDHF